MHGHASHAQRLLTQFMLMPGIHMPGLQPAYEKAHAFEYDICMHSARPNSVLDTG